MPTYDKNFMTENLSNSDRLLQRVFKPKFLVIFYILMIYNHLLTCEKKKLNSGTRDMKIGHFYSEYLKGSDWS